MGSGFWFNKSCTLHPLLYFTRSCVAQCRWFDLVLVVRADNATLYDRLKAR